MARLNFHLFGSPRMEVNGLPVWVDTRKATALLAFLAVTQEAHQRDTLATLLWPDYSQESARAALRRTLSALNRALQKQGASQVLDIARDQVRISPAADLWLDVAEFRRQLASLAEHGHASHEICPACLPALEAAAGLYQNPWMAGFNLRDSPNFEEWSFFQEEALRRNLSGVLEKLSFGLASIGRVEEAISPARRWLAVDPLNEDAHRLVMHLFNLAGQRNAALHQYRECLRILDEELGVAPLEETTRLYESILNREAEPLGTAHLRYLPDVPVSPPARMAQRPPQVETQLGPATPAHTQATALVGRKYELDNLTRAYQGIRQDGYLAFLEGEAGIGKTRLAEALLDQARAGGAVILHARCYRGETGLAYAPFVFALNEGFARPGAAVRLKMLPEETLIEAGRLVPEIPASAGLSSSPQPAWEGAQVRFFEGLRQVISVLLEGPANGILFLDDLHWADHATLELFSYLVRRLAGMPILVLAAWRTGSEDDPGATLFRLDELASELTQAGQAFRLQLKPLTQADITELVRIHAGSEGKTSASTAAFARRLYQESEGSPFIALEYLAAMTAQENTENWEVPSSVRALLQARLAGLDATALQLISAAAVVGRSFDLDILREASGRSELETIDGLDLLLRHGVIVEQANPDGGIRYDFTHENLRVTIYEETSLTRRRLLHRRIAEAIQRVPAAHQEQAGRVAYHYMQAGLNRQAADYYRLAGEQARRVFANHDALEHFQAALAAGHPDRSGLYEAIGDLQILIGAYGQAVQSYQAAAALCAPGCQAMLEHKLGNVHHRLGAWDLAESHYQASLEAVEFSDNKASGLDVPDAFRVHLFADRSLVAHARGDFAKAQELAEKALALARTTGDAHALAQAYNAVGVVARALGDHNAAIFALQESLLAAQAMEDPLAKIAAMNNLALVHGEVDQLEEAIRLAWLALELCQQRGDRHREAALHNNLADLLHRHGQDEEAMAQLKQAVTLFAEVGATSESASAEIWKLTEW